MGKDLRAAKTGSIGHRRSKLGYNDVGYQVGERISHSKDLNNIISIFLKDKKKKKKGDSSCANLLVSPIIASLSPKISPNVFTFQVSNP